MEKRLEIASYYSSEARNLSCGTINRFYFNGVYLDGEIEQICDYDICYLKNPEDFSSDIKEVTFHYYGHSMDTKEKYVFLEGIFPALVDGRYECTAYLWYDKEEVSRNILGEIKNLQSGTQRGLIVLNTDIESIERAKKKYEEREEIL